MKRFLPVMAALAMLMWLPAGASAYTVTFSDVNPVGVNWGLQASNPAVTTYSGNISYPANPGDPGYVAGQYFNANAVCSTLDPNIYSPPDVPDPNNYATSDWSVILTTPVQQYRAGGGLDTIFSIYVKVNHLTIHLADGGSGYAGYSTQGTAYFIATPDPRSSTPPQLTMTYTSGGNLYGVNAKIGLDLASIFSSAPVFNLYDPSQTVNPKSADSVANFTSYAASMWGLKFYLFDEVYSTDVGDNYDANAWGCATFDIFEPGLTDPNPEPAPVPPSMVLLGSGLLSLALIRRRQGRSRQ